MRRRQAGVAAAAAAAAVALLPSAVESQGDYTCQTTEDCGAYAGTFPISNNSTCVADPLDPRFGYCGYVGAPCGTSQDCDYGSCSSGRCAGYLGWSCASDLDCMGYFACGVDGLCGGDRASCVLGDATCLSGSCSPVNDSGGSGRCDAPPAGGMPEGSACSSVSNCATSFCDTKTWLCARVAPGPSDSGAPSVDLSGSVAPSQEARLKTKRHSHSGQYNPKDRRGAIHDWFSNHAFCAAGQTACSTVTGYECIDTQTTLESCGGCPQAYDEAFSAKAIGVDCGTLPFVDEVYCDAGRCKIVSCLSGTRLSDEGDGCIMR